MPTRVKRGLANRMAPEVCQKAASWYEPGQTGWDQPTTMGVFKDNLYNERQNASAKAKQVLLEKFKAKPAPDDPAVLARAAERRAIADAREIRAAERRAIRDAEAVKQAAEQASRELEAQARAAEEARLAAEQVARDLQRKAEQQAARDARYAARKARR